MRSKKKGRPPDLFRSILMNQSEEYEEKRTGARPSGSFEWFAVDRVGCVAALDGRNNGWVPFDVFVLPKKQHLLLYEHFARRNEETCQDRSLSETGYADQGLFYYEIADGESLDGYERIETPTVPLRLHDCTDEIRAMLELVPFDGEFSRTPEIRVTKHWKCV